MNARITVLLLILLTGGCAPGAKRVECDRHLVPINPPNPVGKDAPTQVAP